MRLTFFLTLFSIIPLITSAQQGRQQQGGQEGMQQEVFLKGIILDNDDKTPLAGAHVSLIHIRDTARIFHTMTNSRGEFALELPRGRYTLKASFVGYHTLVLEGEQAVRASSAENDVGRLFLKEGALLDEVEVTGYRSAARLRGDTLDFDARAFKVNPDASAEDLVRRMPGITVDGEKSPPRGRMSEGCWLTAVSFSATIPQLPFETFRQKL
jgi:hypothetical protein